MDATAIGIPGKGLNHFAMEDSNETFAFGRWVSAFEDWKKFCRLFYDNDRANVSSPQQRTNRIMLSFFLSFIPI